MKFKKKHKKRKAAIQPQQNPNQPAPEQGFNNSSAPPVSGAQPPQPVSWPTQPAPQQPPAATSLPPSPFAQPPQTQPVMPPQPAVQAPPAYPTTNPYQQQDPYSQPPTGDEQTAGLLKNKAIVAGVAVLAVAVIGIGGSLMLKSDGKSAAAPLSEETKQNLERKVDLYAIERAIVQYQSSHQGMSPTLANMNNQQFRASSLAGIGLNQTTDPIGHTDQLASSAVAGAYAYVPSPAKCDNKKIKCTAHKLIATLSDGQQISLPQ